MIGITNTVNEYLTFNYSNTIPTVEHFRRSHQACGFVIINAELHKEFDEFKKVHSVYDYNLLEYVEQLECWSLSLQAEKKIALQ